MNIFKVNNKDPTKISSAFMVPLLVTFNVLNIQHANVVLLFLTLIMHLLIGLNLFTYFRPMSIHHQFLYPLKNISIVFIGVSTPPPSISLLESTTPFFFWSSSPPKSVNCPSPLPLLKQFPCILVFRESSP